MRLTVQSHTIVLATAATLLTTIATIGCARHSKDSFDWKPEQIAKLKCDSAKIMEADTTDLTRVDASGIVSNSIFSFADIVRDLRFIPLETTEDSRIGKIARLSFTNTHIIASDERGVHVFDMAGHHIGNIPFGKKSERNDYTIDRASNEILVYTQGSVGHYGMNCQRRSVELIPLQFSAMTATDSGNTMAILLDDCDENSHIGKLQSAPYVVMDRTGSLTNRIGQKERNGNSDEHRPPREGMPLPLSDEGIVISHSLCDTIYTLSDNGLRANYAISYGETLNPLEHKEGISQDLNYIFAGNALVTHSAFFFKIQNARAKTIYGFYDKRTGRLAGGIPAFDYRQMPPIYNPIATQGEYFAATFNTYLTEDDNRFNFLGDYIPEQEKRKLARVTHDSNPVVALYRISVE